MKTRGIAWVAYHLQEATIEVRASSGKHVEENLEAALATRYSESHPRSLLRPPSPAPCTGNGLAGFAAASSRKAIFSRWQG